MAYHLASNGQPIPAFITRKTNITIQDVVYGLLNDASGEVVVNEEMIRQLIIGEFDAIESVKVDSVDERGIAEMIGDYAAFFIGMAKLGFVSMDLDKKGVCHIIAKPTDQKVSDDVMRLLPVVGDGVLRIEE